MAWIGFLDSKIAKKEWPWRSGKMRSCSFAGGFPVFQEETETLLQKLKCKSCDHSLSQFLQVDAPLLSLEIHKRTLHIFFCFQCFSPDSWTAIRFQVNKPVLEQKKQKKVQNSEPKNEKCGLFEDVSWDDESDRDVDNMNAIEALLDEEDDMEVSQSANMTHQKSKFKGEKEESSNFTKAKSVRSPSSIPKSFEGVWISFYKESELKDSETSNSRDQASIELYNKYLAENNLSEAMVSQDQPGGDWLEEQYEQLEKEKEISFQEKIQEFPGQIIKYHFTGSPLLPHGKISVPAVSTCECGHARSFEFQIFPSIIYLLQDIDILPKNFEDYNFDSEKTMNEKKTNDNSTNIRPVLDFGTILVYTCEKSCSSSEYVEELCIYQPPL